MKKAKAIVCFMAGCVTLFNCATINEYAVSKPIKKESRVGIAFVSPHTPTPKEATAIKREFMKKNYTVVFLQETFVPVDAYPGLRSRVFQGSALYLKGDMKEVFDAVLRSRLSQMIEMRREMKSLKEKENITHLIMIAKKGLHYFIEAVDLSDGSIVYSQEYKKEGFRWPWHDYHAELVETIQLFIKNISG